MNYVIIVLASIVLQWDAPTTKVDGSALDNLKDYIVCQSGASISVDRAQRITDITAGTLDCSVIVTATESPSLSCDGLCYYRVFARNTDNLESQPSNEISVNVVVPTTVILSIKSLTP